MMRMGEKGKPDRKGKRREKKKGIELRLKASEERLMSALQRDVFCRQPTLDCQLTELPIQTSQRRSDKRADVVRALGNLRYKGYFPLNSLKQCTAFYNHKMLTVSTNSAKPLQCVLHIITCFTAPRFPSSSGMMSSSQDTEQEVHYFQRSVVKPGDASNETRDDFEKALRCV